MAYKTKTREVTIVDNGGTMLPFFKKFENEKKDFDFEGISALRKLLSNEKCRLLHTIKIKNPGSIYELAKILKRDIKSVKNDIKLLDRFGFIDLISEKSGSRERLKPVIVVDSVYINLKI
jgi:predicted transcriptional regulator